MALSLPDTVLIKSKPSITSQAIKVSFLLAHSLESNSLMLPDAKLRGFLYSSLNSSKSSIKQNTTH